jgi:hypothetical protein
VVVASALAVHGHGRRTRTSRGRGRRWLDGGGSWGVGTAGVEGRTNGSKLDVGCVRKSVIDASIATRTDERL